MSDHALYVPVGHGGCHVHGRAYVVSVADGATARTLELETHPWDAVGAQWRGNDLDVLTASGGRWGIARWTADAARRCGRAAAHI